MKQISIILLLASFSLTVNALQDSVYKTYYADGKLKSITHEGIFNGCYMPVGTDSLFYQSGELMSTIFYDNVKGKKGEGCHEGWTIAYTKTFYKNGSAKSTSQQKYSYEGTPCNCGTWQQKNNKGAVVSSQAFSDCYDQVPCKNP